MYSRKELKEQIAGLQEEVARLTRTKIDLTEENRQLKRKLAKAQSMIEMQNHEIDSRPIR